MYDKRKEIRMAYDLRYGDCFKLLDDIPDKSVDLILTDPPYNIAKYSTGNIDLPGRSALNNDLADWDKTEIEPRELLANFKRIIKSYTKRINNSILFNLRTIYLIWCCFSTFCQLNFFI